MPDAFTVTLNLCKVGINESDDTWGTKLNTNTQLIDDGVAADRARLTALEARMAAGETNIGIGSFYGQICMWAGSVAQIPDIGGVGSNKWRLCDGTNGTPDLKDRFILGAHAGRTPWEAGGAFSTSPQTDDQGSHSHGGATQGHVLTWNEMPAHNHGINDPGHAHGYMDRVNSGDAEANVNGPNSGGQDVARGTDPAGTGISIQSAGGNWGHTHGVWPDGTHRHNVTVSIVPPYFALCYIMRVA